MKSLVSSAVVLALASSAMAAPLIADSYIVGTDPAAGQYQDGIALKNQPATLVNTGFAAGNYAAGSGTSNFGVVAAGLDARVSTIETGGAVKWTSASNDNTTRSNARSFSPILNTTTNPVFYTSVIVQRGDKATAALPTSFVGIGFGNTVVPSLATTGSLTGFYVGFAPTTAGTGDNFGSLVIRSRNTTAVGVTADTVLIDGLTTPTGGQAYFVVVKSIANSPGDSLEYWVNPEDPTSDASMTATSLAHGSVSGFMYQGGVNDLLRLTYSATNWDGSAFFDEPRVGLAISDVFVPEPGGMAGLALAGVAVLHRRRPQH